MFLPSPFRKFQILQYWLETTLRRLQGGPGNTRKSRGGGEGDTLCSTQEYERIMSNMTLEYFPTVNVCRVHPDVLKFLVRLTRV